MSLDVYIEGRFAGRLERDQRERLAFAYDRDYAFDGKSAPLSLSMLPRRGFVHEGAVVERWVDNLLPDNEATRVAIAAKFGMRSTEPYDLLRHVGRDVAGAVQFVSQGEQLGSDGALEEWDEARVGLEIARLRADPSYVNDRAEVGHWSLAGQHGKFALARVGDQWLEPTGSEPSTHIFKVGIDGLRGSDIAEFATMRMAAGLGLRVPSAELQLFDGQLALVVARYDRFATDAGVIRVHQEDMCQVLGVSRHAKYQSDGGPSPEDLLAAVREHVLVPHVDRAASGVVRAQVFNAVTAGTDAHAKNYSLLLRGAGVRLAPLYDLTSAALVWPSKEVRYKAKLAMKFGDDYTLRSLEPQRMARAAASMGVDPDALLAAAGECAAQFRPLAGQALDQAVAAGADPETVDVLRERMGPWADFVERSLARYAQADALRQLQAPAPKPRRAIIFEPPVLAPRAPREREQCGAYIPRSRKRCVLPAGHSGWPDKGHRSV